MSLAVGSGGGGSGAAAAAAPWQQTLVGLVALSLLQKQRFLGSERRPGQESSMSGGGVVVMPSRK